MSAIATERTMPGTLNRTPRKSFAVESAEMYDGQGNTLPGDYEKVPLEKANVITSEIVGSSLHAPVIDLDVPALLVPSTTLGHSHLYIDVPMRWDRYVRLLDALAHAGIIEEGYARASIARGFTAVRPPWVKKKEVVPHDGDSVPF